MASADSSSPTLQMATNAVPEKIKGMAKKPKPADLINHYTSRGMDKDIAAEKVIEDLQKALSISFNQYPMQKLMHVDNSLKSLMQNFNGIQSRLSAVESKLDSKPMFGLVFVAGVAANGFVKAVTEGAPHVLWASTKIFNDIMKATKQ